jgi:hypothetical protein
LASNPRIGFLEVVAEFLELLRTIPRIDKPVEQEFLVVFPPCIPVGRILIGTRNISVNGIVLAMHGRSWEW